MAKRTSALAAHYPVGRHGAPGEPGVILEEIRDLELFQIAAWPDTIDQVATIAAQTAGADGAPGPLSATVGSSGALLRIERCGDRQHARCLAFTHAYSHYRAAGRRVPEPAFPAGPARSLVSGWQRGIIDDSSRGLHPVALRAWLRIVHSPWFRHDPVGGLHRIGRTVRGRDWLIGYWADQRLPDALGRRVELVRKR